MSGRVISSPTGRVTAKDNGGVMMRQAVSVSENTSKPPVNENSIIIREFSLELLQQMMCQPVRPPKSNDYLLLDIALGPLAFSLPRLSSSLTIRS